MRDGRRWHEELAAARVGERPEDKEYYDLTKIKHPTRNMTAAAACVLLALDRLLENMPINSFGDEGLGKGYERRKRTESTRLMKASSSRSHAVRSGKGGPNFVMEDEEGGAWKDLIAHRLFGEPETIDELMNQMWAHAAFLAWDDGVKLLDEAENLARNGSPTSSPRNEDEDEDEMKPEGLPERCVRAATKAAQDINFGTDGDLGCGDDVENGVLKFFITWTKQLAHVDRKMQVARRQHRPAVQAYARLVAKHDKANERLDKLDAAFIAMKRAEEALLEEEAAEEANTVKLHH